MQTKKIYLFSFLIFFCLVSPAWGLEKTFLETTAAYRIEGEDLILELELVNKSKETKQLFFSSGRQFEITITDQENKQVYRCSQDKVFTQALIYKDLKPGQSLQWQTRWTPPCKDQTYTIKIEILARSQTNSKIPKHQLRKTLQFNLETEMIKDKIQTRAEEVLLALKEQNGEKLSQLTHPEKGLRFTPYTYVSLEQDLVFDRENIKNFFEDQTIYLWGYYDGTGFPIRLTPKEYYRQFIFSHDFTQAEQVGYNEVLAKGNRLENQFQIYQDPIIVEYYFPGFNPNYAGLDWRSLRLVFQEHRDCWYLAGLIYNQWTI